MQVGFRVLDDDHAAGFCRQKRDDDRKRVTQSKSNICSAETPRLNIAWTIEFESGEGHVGRTHCFKIKMRSRACLLQPCVDLIDQLTGRGVAQTRIVLRQLIRPMLQQHMEKIFSVHTYVCIAGPQLGKWQCFSRTKTFALR